MYFFRWVSPILICIMMKAEPNRWDTKHDANRQWQHVNDAHEWVLAHRLDLNVLHYFTFSSTGAGYVYSSEQLATYTSCEIN